MKLGDSNVMYTVAAVLWSLALLAKSQRNVQGHENSNAKYGPAEVPILVDSKDDDFIVKFKGEIISLRKITKLLHQQNIYLPQENEFFNEVHRQKKTATRSCEGRCFLKEIRQHESCYCDNVCRTFGDCCLDFYSRCDQNSTDVPLEKVECGDVNSYLWSGIIMTSTCSLYNSQSTKDCHSVAVQHLNMTLRKELPVFGWKHNVTYRSIACAKCNNEGNTAFWGLNISCKRTDAQSKPPPNITAVAKFLKEHKDCSWKYAPTENLTEHYRPCVAQDSLCASNKLSVLTVVKELCAAYSMVFTVVGQRSYRNPHCALCNPKGWPIPQKGIGPSQVLLPLSILLDVSTNIEDLTEPKNSQPTFHTESPIQGFNLSSQLLNCTSTVNNCTATIGGKTCKVLTLPTNLSNQVRSFSSNKSLMMVKTNQISYDHEPMRLQGNTVYILCPEHQAEQTDSRKRYENDNPVLNYITLTGMPLSMVSLCLLLIVYLSFQELRNLPGKCVINLSGALLCYQAIFLTLRKSTEVDALCKAVAIFLHFFILAVFAWMSVMAFDTANTFSTKVTDTRRQPSDTRKIFIKYFIVGWGLPAVVVGLCSVLDFTGSFHIGYGNSGYCWISDKTAMGVVMVTPVSVALIFNMMCLTKNIYAIRHLQQAANLATSNSSRASLALICIKLTTVMGLTWILALAANWKQTEFLHYPSTVLNSMQGFFITLCFVTTKRVRGLLKGRFSKRLNGANKPRASTTHDKRTAITDVERAGGSSIITREQERMNSS